MAEQEKGVDLDYDRLLGFDRAPRGEAGKLTDPGLCMVGLPKDPGDTTPDDDAGGDGIQAGVERLLGDPRHAELLVADLAERVHAQLQGEYDAVAAVCIGGVAMGYELARQLGVRILYLERHEAGFRLRPGSELEPGARCLVADDTVMRGRTLRGCIDALAAEDASAVAGCCLLDSSQEREEVGIPIVSIAESVEELEARLPRSAPTEAGGERPALG
jgi:orotate phosphoribosyltransferase